MDDAIDDAPPPDAGVATGEVSAPPTATPFAAGEAAAAIRAGLVGVGTVVALSALALIEIAAMGAAVVWRIVGALLLGGAAAAFSHAAVARPLTAALRGARARAERTERDHVESTTRLEVVERAGRAIAIAEDEREVLAAAAAAARQLVGDRGLELLHAAGDAGRVTRRVRVDGAGRLDATPIPSEGDTRCVAATTRRAVSSATTAAFDACPHARAGTPTSATCVPIVVDHATVAVLHVSGPEGQPADAATVDALGRVAAAAADRIAALRPTREDDVPDSVDPLTGLPNHRTARRAIRDLIGGLTPFSIAVCDVDRLGAYNDEFGPQAGDRALQLFAEALRTTLRPGDVVVRWGGDEFLAVFPRCSSLHAQAAMERVRERLVLSMATAGMAPFTCSTGVADSNQGASVDELIESADLALSIAKHEGGNRVRTAVF